MGTRISGSSGSGKSGRKFPDHPGIFPDQPGILRADTPDLSGTPDLDEPEIQVPMPGREN